MQLITHKIIVCLAFLCVTICAFSQNNTVQQVGQQSIEDLLLKEIETTITENLTVEQAINDSLINSVHATTGNHVGLTVSIDSLIAFGKTFVGLPYRSKIEGVSQLMDCSGYMGMLFQTFGVTLPRSSAEIADVTKKIPLKEAQVGDFIFFKGRNVNQSRVGHVALIIENDNGTLQMMHSSVSKGITIDTYPDTYYYCKRFVKVGRL